MIAIEKVEAIKNVSQRVGVIGKVLTTTMGSETKVIVKLVSPLKVSVRYEEHVARITLFRVEMKSVGWV